MAQPHLDLVHGFGVAGGVDAARVADTSVSARFRKSRLPEFLGDCQVLCPYGRQVALHDLQSRAMTFVPHSEGSDRIGAMAVAPQRRHFAVCEVVHARPSHRNTSVVRRGTL